MDLFRGIDLRLDTICLDSYGERNLSTHDNPLAVIRVDGSEDSMEG